MAIVVEYIQWIMVAAAALTLTMLQAVFAPRAAARSMFGEDLESAAALLVVRNWAALVVGGAALLIYAAFTPEWRPLVLIFVGAGKMFFIALVLSHGRRFLKHQAGIAVLCDAAIVVLFAVYLAQTL